MALILHAVRRAYNSTLEQVAAVKTPPSVNGRWVPVPHLQVRQNIHELLVGKHAEIEKEEMALTTDGQRFFGLITLRAMPGLKAIKGTKWQFGFSNAHDKSMSVRLAWGSGVTVCDNQLVSGSTVVCVRHTKKGINRLRPLMADALDEFTATDRIDDYNAFLYWSQNTVITDEQINDGLIRMAERECITWPDVPKVLFEMRRPDGPGGVFPELNEAPTVWKLLMAVTEVHKRLTNPALLTSRAQDTVRMLQTYRN